MSSELQIGELVRIPEDAADLAEWLRQNHDHLVSGDGPDLIVKTVLQSYQGSNKPTPGTAEFRYWWNSINEEPLHNNPNNKMPYAMRMWPPGGIEYTKYIYASLLVQNGATSTFEAANDTVENYISQKSEANPVLARGPLEEKYLTSQHSFQANIFNSWVAGKDVGTTLGIVPSQGSLEELCPPGVRALVNPNLLSVEEQDKIYDLITSNWTQGEALSTLSSLLPTKDDVVPWWNLVEYRPFYESTYEAYSVVLEADGVTTAPFLTESISMQDVQFPSIDKMFASRDRSMLKSGKAPTAAIIRQGLAAGTLNYAGGVPEDALLAVVQPNTDVPFRKLKKSAINYLLQYFDKQGQYIDGLGFDPSNEGVIEDLANRAVITGYYYDPGNDSQSYESDFPPPPSSPRFKVSIHTSLIDKIPLVKHEQQRFEQYFKAPYDGGYWQKTLKLTTLQTNLKDFKSTMEELHKDFVEWRKNGNSVEPEEWSFLEELRKFEDLITCDSYGGALVSLLDVNADVTGHPISLPKLKNDPQGAVTLLYNENYGLQGVYVSMTNPNLTAPTTPDYKYPIKVAFEEFRNDRAFSSRNICYLANMVSIIDDHRRGKNWKYIIENYVAVPPVLKDRFQATKTPGIKTREELNNENAMLGDRALQKEILEKSIKSKHASGDPTFEFIEETIARLNSIEDAYKEYLDRYGMEWVIKEIILCLMNILGLPLDCPTQVRMALEYMGLEEFRQTVLVPYAEFAGENLVGMQNLAHQSMTRNLNTHKRREQEVSQRYYQNQYRLAYDDGMSRQERAILEETQQDLKRQMQGLQHNQRAAAAWQKHNQDVAAYAAKLGRMFDLEQICRYASDIFRFLMEEWKFPPEEELTAEDNRIKNQAKIKIPDFPTSGLFEAIAKIIEDAIKEALRQVILELVRGLMRLIKMICNDLKIGINKGQKKGDAQLPVGADQLRDLLSDLFGAQQGTRDPSLMDAVDPYLNAINPQPSAQDQGLGGDLAEQLAQIIDQLAALLLPSEICDLINGSPSTALITKIKRRFSKVPGFSSLFADDDQIIAFFAALGRKMDPQFCEALTAIDPSDIEDLCELPPGTLADANNLGENNVDNYDALKQQLKDLLNKLAALLAQLQGGGNPAQDAIPPILGDPCQDVERPEGAPPPPPPPLIKWKDMPVVANANKLAVDTFYTEVVQHYQKSVPTILSASMMDGRILATTEYRLTEADEVKATDFIEHAFGQDHDASDDDRIQARILYLGQILESLERNPDFVKLEVRRAIGGGSETGIPGRPGPPGGYAVAESVIGKLKNPGAYVAYPSMPGLFAGAQNMVGDTLNGKSFTYRMWTDRKQPFARSVLEHTIQADGGQGPSSPTGESYGSIFKFSTTNSTHEIQLAINGGNVSHNIEMPYPAAPFIAGLDNEFRQEFGTLKNFMPVGKLQFTVQPTLRITNPVQQLPGRPDLFTISYKKRVEARQDFNQDGNFGDPIDSSLIGEGFSGIFGEEEYNIFFNDYYRTTPGSPQTGKEVQFMDFVRARVEAQYGQGQPSSIAVRPRQQRPLEEKIYNRLSARFTDTVTYQMCRGASSAGAHWTAQNVNPLFDPEEVSDIQFIPTSNARIKRSKGYVKAPNPELLGPNGPEEGWWKVDTETHPDFAYGDLLNITALKDKVMAAISADPACEDENDPWADKNLSDLEKAAVMGVMYLILRAYTLEFILTVLPFTLTFKISDMFKSNVLPLMIVQHLKMDLSQDKRYYCEFMKAVNKVISDRRKKGDPSIQHDPLAPEFPAMLRTDEEKLVFLLKEQVLPLEREFNYIIETHAAAENDRAGVNSPWAPGADGFPAPWRPRNLKDIICNPNPLAGHHTPSVGGTLFYSMFRFPTLHVDPEHPHVYLQHYYRIVWKSDVPQQIIDAWNNYYLSQMNIGTITDPAGGWPEPLIGVKPSVVGVQEFRAFAAQRPANTNMSDYIEDLRLGTRLMFTPGIQAAGGCDDRNEVMATQGRAAANGATDEANYIAECAGLTSANGDLQLDQVAAYRERAFYMIDHIDGSYRLTYTIPIASAERSVSIDRQGWGHVPAGTTQELEEEMYTSPEATRLLEYIYPTYRYCGSAFVMVETLVSMDYYKTDTVFAGMKVALRNLFFILINEDAFGANTGQGSDEWSLALTGLDWEKMMSAFSLDPMKIIIDTVMSIIIGILQLMAATFDPWGLIRWVLCPQIKPDDWGAMGGMARTIKKAWDCGKGGPGWPDFPFPFPDTDDPSDPSKSRKLSDIEKCIQEGVPDYFLKGKIEE